MKRPPTESSFAEARTTYQGYVFGFVSRRIKPVEDAEDVTVEVFVDAYRNWRKCTGDPRLWLLGIARRKVADAYRRRKPHFQLSAKDEPAGDTFEEFVGGYQSQQALQLLQKLPPDQRDALLLQILEELSIEEIAKVMGRSHAATNSLLQRARKQERSIVNAQEVTQGV